MSLRFPNEHFVVFILAVNYTHKVANKEKKNRKVNLSASVNLQIYKQTNKKNVKVPVAFYINLTVKGYSFLIQILSNDRNFK